MPLALGPWALGSALQAQALVGSDGAEATPGPDIHQEMATLIRADARALAPPPVPLPPPSAAATGNVLTLSPYIVRATRSPDLPAPASEAPLSDILRTGVIYTHVGKKVTSSLYINIGGSGVPASGTAAQSFRTELGWRISF